MKFIYCMLHNVCAFWRCLLSKERLDLLLIKKGFFETREKARASIMAGVVYINNIKEDKPGTKFDDNVEILVKENINPYVSRGGLKLKKAITEFNIDLKGKLAIDVGSSTGGFTDCMLKEGAMKVLAIDVGYGQLAWELRNDSRVICMERTNVRYVKPSDLEFLADFVTIDVSFISLKKILPVIKEFIKNVGQVVCLIKPQFEAGRDKVGKHGVVRDPLIHKEVISSITSFSESIGFNICGLTYSPIKGPEGNIEYLLYISKSEHKTDNINLGTNIDMVISDAHSLL